ncbi:MAG: DNA/RNA non-specific endonuclease, partial [Bacteroidales bacterium]|nr:DNA/RNA non-specific endonuclease [Bacteroidales bacterium]
DSTLKYELPYFEEYDTVIYHSYYSFNYNETHEQSNWVAYELTSDMLIKNVNRTNNFRMDPRVSTLTANNADYRKSGYDRGHLVPAGDMSFDSIAMVESFYFSNISPQVPSFNRGIWKYLEDRVRKWAQEFEQIYVIVGPILKPDLPSIGKNEVSVPEEFYKAILVYNDSICKAIAFVIPNENELGENYEKYVCTVDSLENLINLDLFHYLDDFIEDIAESEIDYEFWGINLN